MQTIPNLTPQQVYDNALNGVRGQDYASSRNSNGCCAYRGDGNTRCGIGHSIPDELYEADMDLLDGGSEIAAVVKKFALVSKLFKNCTVDFLIELQDAHDNIRGPICSVEVRESEFEARMQDIAETYGLNYSLTSTTTTTNLPKEITA